MAQSPELSESQTKKLKIGADGLEVPPPDVKRQKTVESLTSAGSGSEALDSCRSPSVSGFAPDEMAAGIVTARKVAMLLEQFKAISQDAGVTAHTRELLDELMALCCNKLDRVRLSASRKRGRAHQRSRTTDIMHCKEAAEWHPVPEWHAEAPERVAASLRLLTSIATKSPAKVTMCDVTKQAAEEIVKLVHAPSYVARIQERADEARKEQKCCLKLINSDSDTFVSENTYNAAMLAAGAVCEAIDQVMKGGTTRNAFCCIRPPGHHAGRRGGALGECSQGFCLLNNICVGAAHSRIQHFIRKVCIVDFDVHHGNGTEEIVRGDFDTLFLSVHRHSKAFYPTGCGSTGQNGTVVNTGLNEGFGGSEFRSAMNDFIRHIDNFVPELILISAG